MATIDFDPCLIDLCRQLDCRGQQINSSPDDNDNTLDGHCALSLDSLPLSEYTREELQFLSSSLGKCRLDHLEIEAVDDLDWEAILNHEDCTLTELHVAVRSSRALADLAKSLFCNNSLSSLELYYYHLCDDIQEQEHHHDDYDDEDGGTSTNALSTNTLASSITLNEIFFQALMPLQHVVLRGLTSSGPFSSTAVDDQDRAMTYSWEYLRLEECDLTGDNTIWLASCITNLQEIVIHNCQLSEATIKMLSEAYLGVSTSKFGTSLKSNGQHQRRRRRHKHALQVLNLSNNDWFLPLYDGDIGVDNISLSTINDDVEDFDDYELNRERRTTLPSPSCMTFLASWLDSLSNLVELDLSQNPKLFNRGVFKDTNRGIVDLCGTVNQSLKRLSLRHCCLIPGDLYHLVNTFCWLEALDLSENPELTSNLRPLSQLEYLTELVLENMLENNSNDSFAFERLLCDEDFDMDTKGQGLTDLLFEFLSGENTSFFDFDGNSRIREFDQHRRKSLERLNLSGNVLSKKTLNILSMFKSLKVLILMGCQINDEGMRELLSDANIVSQNCSSLRELYVASNIIGDIGALALAQSLKEQRLPRLKVLDIGSNVISFEAFRVFVEDGVVHTKSLESVEVSNDGAITQNQRQTWNELEKIMEHNLLLNQAGRFTLYMDSNGCGYDRKDDEVCMYNTCEDYNNKRSRINISTNLWPFILEDADTIYGPDALFYFLHKRPDLILSSKLPPQRSSINYHDGSTMTLKPTPQTRSSRSSPNGVSDIAARL